MKYLDLALILSLGVLFWSWGFTQHELGWIEGMEAGKDIAIQEDISAAYQQGLSDCPHHYDD